MEDRIETYTMGQAGVPGNSGYGQAQRSLDNFRIYRALAGPADPRARLDRQLAAVRG